MIKKTFLIWVLLASAFLIAQPTEQANEGRIAISADRLAGDWVSVALSGDDIWLVVKTVGVKLDKKGNFRATAVLDGGDHKLYKGEYHIDDGKIRLVTEGQEQDLICTYTLDDGKLTLKPKSHDITAVFKRGQLKQKKAAPPQGMGRMHF